MAHPGRLAAAAVAVALGLSTAAGGVAAPADCRHVQVIDAATGHDVRGIEDIAVDFAAGVAFLSAHDRRAVARAVDENAARLPHGNIYRLPLARLDAAATALTLDPATRPMLDGDGFLPHGIGLYESPSGSGLYAVNRRYARRDDRWAAAVTVEQFDRVGNDLVHRRTVSDPSLCRANDVAGLDGQRFLFTSDGGACSGLAGLPETILNLPRATVSLFDDGRIRPVATGLRYANGIVLSGDHAEVAVAATRARTVVTYDMVRLLGGGPVASPDRVLDVDGGPDNLTLDAQGGIVAAILPNLFRYALFRFDVPGFARAASRVVGIATARSATTTDVLFDDPDGRILPGVTVAIRGAGWLVAGSAMASGLAVCGGVRGSQ